MLGVTHPVILAPMLKSSGGELAGQVARAGGVGLIGVGTQTALGPEWVKEQYEIAKSILLGSGDKKIKGALGFGFFDCFMKDKNKDKSFIKALDLKPDLIWMSFFDSLAPYSSDVHSTGAKLIVMVHSVTEAQNAVREGADIIVLQGSDAGGHGYQYKSASVISLIPEAYDNLDRKIPLVAAGGISDGRGLASALVLGASGVVVGTRFFASKEALTSQKIKKNLVDAHDGGYASIISAAFDSFSSYPWSTRVTARGLRDHAVIKKYHHLCLSGEFRYKPTKEEQAEYDKLQESQPITWAGTGVGLINSIDSAGDIVNKMIKEAESCLKNPKSFQIV